ncbi:hypothetical protein, partial [Spirosoma sp.]|uniref:hypothetical protein n=1 Tax=Spirosoma sp. TaxID=1899569 RepID=UPI003B3B5618
MGACLATSSARLFELTFQSVEVKKDQPERVFVRLDRIFQKNTVHPDETLFFTLKIRGPSFGGS